MPYLRLHGTSAFGSRRETAVLGLALAIVWTLTIGVAGTAQAQTYNVIHNFVGGRDGSELAAGLTLDAAGNLYGTTHGGGAYNAGTAFKLTPASGSWKYASLHDFTGGDDGGYPRSNITFDKSGNLYGAAAGGGTMNYGVVFEITPQT